MTMPAPTTLEILDANELLGRVTVEEEPADTLLRRINWLYETYTPAAVCIAPWQADDSNSVEFIVPITPSVDNLNYQPAFVILTNTTGNVTVEIDESTDASSWSTVTGWGAKSLACAAQDANVFWGEDSFPVASASNFLRITVTHALSSPAYVQLPAFVAYPSPLEGGAATPLTHAAKWPGGQSTSGVHLYDDDHLTSTGAALHTEYIERVVRSVSALAADRVQSLGGFMQATTGGALDLSFTTSKAVRTIYYGVPDLPWNEGGATDVTVKVYWTDGGSGTLTVGQFNSPDTASWHKFTDDTGTHQSTTITVYGSRPQLVASVSVDTRCDVLYVVFEVAHNAASAYAPTGSSTYVPQAAPPPLIEYLGAMEDLTLRLAVHNYAMPALVFDPGAYLDSDFNAAGSIFASESVAYVMTRVPAGVYGMKASLVSATDDSGGSAPDVEIGSVVGSGGAEQHVTLPSEVGGGAQPVWDEDAGGPSTFEVSAEYAASGNGNNPLRITKSLEPQVHLMVVTGAYGIGGSYLQVARKSLANI